MTLESIRQATAQPGRLVFALAIVACGIEFFLKGRLHAAVVPVIPWPPPVPALAYALGAVLLWAGLALALDRGARPAALVVGTIWVLGAPLASLAAVAAAPHDIGLRTRLFEPLALGAAAWMLAATLPPGASAAWNRAVGRLATFGLYLFAFSSLVFGIDQFEIIPFIVSLIPAWMPARLFLAYFTSVAFVAAAVAIATNRWARWTATLLGVMFAIMVITLHLPLITHDPGLHNPNTWCSLFIAVAMAGAYWICAQRLPPGVGQAHPAASGKAPSLQAKA